MHFLGVSFSYPTYVPPVTAWLMHGPFANWLVNACKPRRVVELGTHYGFSYFCFCEAVLSHKIEAECFAVDTWAGDEHAGFYGEDVYDAVAKENERYSHFSRLIRKTFSEALSDIPDGTVDLLHVDGRHFYDDVKLDFESWLPKLSDRAIVLFHDTEVKERDFGIWRYWSEVSAGRISVNFPYQHGLGLLFWGPNVPDGMAIFVELLHSPNTRSLVIDQFLSVGEAFAQNDKNIRAQYQRIDELQHTINLMNIQLKNTSAQIFDLKSEIGLRQSQISSLEGQNRAQQSAIVRLKSELNLIENMLESARKQPLQQFAQLATYRSLRLFKEFPVPLPNGVHNKLSQIVNQLDPERRELHRADEQKNIDHRKPDSNR